MQNDWIDRDTAREVYGVIVAGSGRAATVDEAATAAQRKAIRARRLSRGVPVREWWKATRPRVLAGEFIEPVRSMHRDCLGFEHYRDEFTSFWALDEAFGYTEEGAV